MTEQEALPNFFILGAAKAGTTTLFELLKQHPQIHLPYDKEPMFFSRDDYFARGLQWYSRTFFKDSHGAPASGEASPHYLYWAEKVAPRMREAFAGRPVRFLITIRDPVARAYSWYWNMVQEGEESLPFVEALQAEAGRLQRQEHELRYYGSMRFGYHRGGCYASQLRVFLECFATDCFQVILLDDLLRDRPGTMKKICAFLGIDEAVPFRAVRGNPAWMPRSGSFQRFLRGPSLVKSLAKPLLPGHVRHRAKTFLRKLNLREERYPPLPAEAAAWLRSRFAAANRDLAALIGRDLSGWNG